MTGLTYAVRRSLLLLCLATAACSARGHTRNTVHEDRNRLSAPQLAEGHFTTAYDAVEALRPHWMQTHGTNSLTATPGIVLVYQDANRLGGVETLRQISIGSVVYIKYYNALEATARWGIDHTQGVIYVSTTYY